ncbi:hypothetical protein GCM10008905_07020 [Clostridium malenominatum]|uniref:IDEAL domain-containing protein n=1 Tax=Clostridium malenominatum TaxID=1539 RepID=A0ABP3TW94_9CLOT
MEINNFVLPKNALGNRFKFGIRFIPDRALNRYLDYILFVVKNDFKGEELYNLCFKAGRKFNNFIFDKNSFEGYLSFLKTIDGSEYSPENKISKEFLIKGDEQKVIISSLNEKYFKVLSVKGEEKVFFVLTKEEIMQHLHALSSLYREKIMAEKLSKPLNNFLREYEKKEIYLGALNILLNDALDRNDKEKFIILSNEINKMKKSH